MRRILVLLIGLVLISPAKAADSTVTAMSAASAFGGTELLYVVQGAADRKGTPAQMATYIYSLASGDCTISGVGAVVCTKTNGVAFTALATTAPGTGVATALGINVGSAGAFVTFNGALGTPSSGTLTNATGLPIAGLTGLGAGVGTWLATPSSANLFAALTTKTGSGGSAVFATGPSITSPLIGTAAQLSYITGSTQCLHVDTSGNITGTGSDCGSAAGVTSITPGGGLVSGITASCTQTAITTTGTLSEASCLNPQTGTTYTVLDTDRAKLVTLSNAATIAVTVPQAGTASAFANGWRSTFMNKGVGTATFTPTTSTINGAATYLLFSGQSITIASDGTNYQVDPGTSGGIIVSLQTGANYPFVSSDFGKLINLSNAANQIPTIPIASALGANWFVQACNQGAGTQTITPTTSLIGGAATYVLAAGTAAAPKCVGIVSDGTNYQVVLDASGGGGTPGGSSGQIQYNNAGAFGGFTMANDCTLSQPNINCNLDHPGYVANNWYVQPGVAQPSVTQNGGMSANAIWCSYVPIPRVVTVLAMSATVTVVGTTNVQYAIYANASGRPSTLIGNTGSVVNTSTGPRDANLSVSKQIGPGGTNGGRDVWFCVNQNDSTAQYINNGGINFNEHQFIGSSSSANLSISANDAVVGLTCSGANCNGGSSTFGSWPANLTGSTWTQVQPSVTGSIMPVFQYKAQ